MSWGLFLKSKSGLLVWFGFDLIVCAVLMMAGFVLGSDPSY